MYKFEKLEVWQLAMEYIDLCYSLSAMLPKREEYNLTAQIRSAAVSIALNVAEGSTSQSDPEQARFLAMAIRSLIETVACLHLIYRRKYLEDLTPLRETYRASNRLAAKLQSMRRSLLKEYALREEVAEYVIDTDTPFDKPMVGTTDHPLTTADDC